MILSIRCTVYRRKIRCFNSTGVKRNFVNEKEAEGLVGHYTLGVTKSYLDGGHYELYDYNCHLFNNDNTLHDCV